MNRLPALDVVVLLAYIVGVVAFGCWFVRKSGTSREFMAAGGALPGWAVGLSIFGTYLSSNTFLGVPGKAYGTNWNSFVFSLSLPLSAWLAVRFFVPFYRRGGEISAYHHLERRFGPWARFYAVLCYLLTQLARMGSILFGVALGLTALTGWDMALIILGAGLLVTLYTLLGGIEAVIWTDVTQSIVLGTGALTVAGLLMFGTPEGPAQVIRVAAEHDKFSLGSAAVEFGSSTVWVVLLYGVFMNLNNFGIDQSFVQRYHTARDDREAARSVWLGALLYVPVSLLFFFIGSCLYSYYSAHPELLAEVTRQVATSQLERTGETLSELRLSDVAATLTPADVGDKVLPHFIATGLPPGVAGLLLAAIFAAAMSSIDTSLNSSATVFLSDVYARYVDRDVDERRKMRVLRVATAVWGLAGTGTALAMIGVGSVLDAWWQLSGIFAGGMLGLFLLGMVARRADGAAAAGGVIVGLLVIFWMTFSPESALPEVLHSPFHSHMIIVVGTLAIFVTGLVLSRLRRSAAQV